jgi:DNA-binding transcriptional LysR family regulator
MDQLAGMLAFVRVVEEGSFTAAAKSLGLPKSTVSRQVSSLEERLGARLLHRTTRRIHLTEAGQAYFDRCARVISELEDAEKAVTELHEAPRGTLKLTAPVTFGQMFLTDVLTDYLNQYPDVRLDLNLSDRTVDLVEEGFDLAIRIGRLADSSLVVRKLGVSRMCLCAAPAYLEKAGAPQSVAELEEKDALLYTYQANGWRLKGGRMVSVRGRLSTNSGEVLRGAAVRGLGIAYVPSFYVGADLAAGRLISLLEDQIEQGSGVFAVYPPKHQPPAKVRAFVDLAVERFAGGAGWERRGIEPA